jgi:iron complex outermembrane receptor protein
MIRSRSVFCLLVFFTCLSHVFGQSANTADTLTTLREAVVQGYLSQQTLLQTPASIGILHARDLQRRAGSSLLPALNQLPGVRMEERSPGSFRLSIRGSLLRSPFGVRNVKVYMDEFPLTDAGGNTYLNLLDPRGIERIEILKGPDGSLFGANSGGVVLMDLNGRKNDQNDGVFGLQGGAFGAFHEHASLHFSTKKSRFSVNQGFQRSDGYRENTALRRHYLQASEQWNYRPGHSLKFLALYADLQYQTPGGLTQAQFEENPRQARPAAGSNPGAVAQKAGVFNRTFWGGVRHESLFSSRLRWVAAVFGAHTRFENPFITNYEKRTEINLGLRTFLEYFGAAGAHTNWKWSAGMEGQTGRYDISNFQNNGGTAGAPIAADELAARQVFYFTRISATIRRRLTVESALSWNQTGYKYPGSPAAASGEWMPRFAASWLFGPDFAVRASVSRGYSPPTSAEIRPSNQVINPSLQAETGWNREAGLRWSAWKGRLLADASVFRYDLENAIVRRTDPAGAEFFVNAGGTRQTGVESLVAFWAVAPRQSGFLRALQLTGSFTYSRFFFRNYQTGASDFSGNPLTGVPQTVMVWSILWRMPQELSLFVESNATSRLPLNDANTDFAAAYHLLQAKVSWSKLRFKKTKIRLYAGADNLLNQKYSLGNDLNAFGGRYFNAAPPLNFYGGVVFDIGTKEKG